MDPLTTLKHELQGALHGLDTSQTQLRKPGVPEAWTVQQIAEHLRLSYASTRGVMETRIAKGVPTRTPVTPLGRVAQFAITRCGYFPRKRQAPAIVMPGKLTPLDGDSVYQTVAADVDAMAKAIDEVERLLGSGRTVNHAVLGPMSAAQWRRFHLVHGRHHVRQIWRIRKLM